VAEGLFQLESSFSRGGREAIRGLVRVCGREPVSARLLGVTGIGETYTIAQDAGELDRPCLGDRAQ